MQEELFDGKYYRDAGTQIALDHAGEVWHDRAVKLALLRFKAAGSEGCLFEQVRIYAQGLGMDPPPSHKAWGAVCLHLSKAKKIERTGIYLPSEDPRSHAHYSPVWRLKESHGS